MERLMTDIEFRFSPGLDLDAASQSFQASGRARVFNVLEPACADALHACLSRQVPWRLAYNRGDQALLVDPVAARGMDAAQQQQLNQEIIGGARKGFQYAYYSYPMVTAYLNRDQPDLLLHRLLEWLVSPAVLETVRRVTGIESLRKCDGQATCYLPGHFLTQHDDRGTGSEGRRVGYVLNLTREWRPDWGGLLHFLSPDGSQVEEAWVPRFNSLALFRVPVMHAVSYVSPFAQHARFAVTGWFRDV
jgi:Rps23 Pro-64 3,4-dihydroxylase Tpa1-like proline 4-hydroxylase